MAIDPMIDANEESRPRHAFAERAEQLVPELDQVAFEHAPVAICSMDLHGRIRSWNKQAERLLGWSAEEIIGQPVPFLANGDERRARRSLLSVLEDGVLANVEFEAACADGSTRHVVGSASVLRDGNDLPVGVLGFLVDVTPQRQATDALAANEHKWRALLQNITDTVTIVDANQRVLETSAEFQTVLGHNPATWIGGYALDLIHPDDHDMAHDAFAWVEANPGVERQALLRTLHADGHYEVIEYTARNLLHDPAVNGVVLTTRNVTAVKRAEALLASESSILELIARDASLDETLPAVAAMVADHTTSLTGVFMLPADDGPLTMGGTSDSFPDDLVDAILLVPPVWLITEYQRSPDRHVFAVPDLTVTASNPLIQGHQQQLLDLGFRSVHIAPIADRRSDELFGIIVWYHQQPHVATDHENNAAAVAGHLAAIAIERARAQNELVHRARHDALTGLPNRSVVLEHLASALSRARRTGNHVAVLFVDLDRFKVVNDSLGHGAGDRLIARFAGRLANLVRPDDLVGHFAADEFVIVLENVDEVDEALVISNRIERSLKEPFGLPEGEVILSASTGIALSTGTETAEELLHHADAALAQAKRLGRSRAEIYDRDLRALALEQLRIEHDLRQALDRNELAVHFQPELSLATGRIVGAEALLRWHHPERGLVAPDEFITIAEETGMIRRIGAWVLEESIRHAVEWRSSQPAHHAFVISVNLSARQLTSPELVETVRTLLDRYGWPPAQLMLELTESILIDDRDTALDTLGLLKGLGVRLAIDDFGTGYSSLNYLHRFPVDVVKIDRSFVAPLEADGSGSPVATAVLQVARVLGLVCCAEGVEEASQLEGLRLLGCDWAQGFHFAIALPPDEFAELLEANGTW